ncbi:MAG: tandem-95 repeat protein [Gammaproteobacteria bacterium]|nr:tandem-95 repeat protein [Gammaproteobacteria bacterium]
MKIKQQLISITLTSILSCGTAMAEPEEGNDASVSEPEGGQLVFIGNSSRIAVGVDSENDIRGEYFQVFAETKKSAWIGEGWLARRDAGGLKLNYHWLSAAPDKQENPEHGSIQKTFLAIDQNEHQDQKLTAGWGSENDSYFYGGYLSASLTGRRHKGVFSTAVTDTISASENGRDFLQSQTTTTISNVYERPYDYGAGVRMGRYYDNKHLRLRGGLDYETGEEDARQYTLSLGLEKFFRNSPHSIAVNTEFTRKSGEYETDREDARIMAVWRYEFGKSQRPEKRYRQVQVTHTFAPAAVQETKKNLRLIKHNVDVKMGAFFDFDGDSLTPPAVEALNQTAKQIKTSGFIGYIKVTGHACSIGPTVYNQDLSERRAGTVIKSLIAQGIDANALILEGKGESEPKYPNDTEENRKKNRRVDIEFITSKETWETAPVMSAMAAKKLEPYTEWKREEIKTEPAWLRRALRNPIVHKQTVDYYRIEKQETVVAQGSREFINGLPQIAGDALSVSSSNAVLDVLANDSDPDGDALSIIGVTQPRNGSVINNGNNLSYMAAAGFMGADSFTYTASDGNGGDGTATVNVTVLAINEPPQANNDTAVVRGGVPVNIDVLANDFDPEGDSLTITELSQPAYGSVAVEGTSVRYTPNSVFGIDTFTYTVSDGHGNTAAASVTVRDP